ncbi:MAG: hypothetical protein WCG47_28440, partial [Dermatophilaceae bacterium]
RTRPWAADQQLRVTVMASTTRGRRLVKRPIPGIGGASALYAASGWARGRFGAAALFAER